MSDGAPATGARRALRPVPFGFEPGGFLLVVSGPSGAGKGTLVDRLVAARPECVFSISATTRPRRVDRAGRRAVRVRHARGVRAPPRGRAVPRVGRGARPPLRHAGRSRSTSGGRAGRVVVLDVDVQGGASVRRARPDAVSVFIYPPSIDALRQRLLGARTDAPEVVERRLRTRPARWRSTWTTITW